MLKWLVAVDGSDSAVRAVSHMIDKLAWFRDGVEIHLLNVQHPMPYGNRVTSVLGHDKVEQYHREEGLTALQPARAKLDAAGVKYVFHIGVGDAAETIVKYATEKGCDQIVMGTRGLGSVSSMILGSVATKVIHATELPVLLIK
ncbi:MAG: universal stress protein [Burkholderiales bacterium]